MGKVDLNYILPVMYDVKIKNELKKYEESYENQNKNRIKNGKKPIEIIGFAKSRLLSLIGLDDGTFYTEKFDEWVELGFIEKVNDNPEQFLLNMDWIYETWIKLTWAGKVMRMLEDRKYFL